MLLMKRYWKGCLRMTWQWRLWGQFIKRQTQIWWRKNVKCIHTRPVSTFFAWKGETLIAILFADDSDEEMDFEGVSENECEQGEIRIVYLLIISMSHSEQIMAT